MDEPASANGIQWTNAPPAAPGRCYRILSPRPGTPVGGVILGREILGVITHWMDSRTLPCMKVLGHCEGCSAGLPKRWKGYLAILAPGEGRFAILEITEEARRSCEALRDQERNLRGERIMVFRRGTSKRSAVQAQILPFALQPNLPESFDLKEALHRIWRLHWT